MLAFRGDPSYPASCIIQLVHHPSDAAAVLLDMRQQVPNSCAAGTGQLPTPAAKPVRATTVKPCTRNQQLRRPENI